MAFCVCHPRSTRATAHAKCTTWPHASIAHGLALSGSGGVPSHAGHGSKCAGRGGRCAPRGFLRGGPREAGRGISAASNARESAEASSSAFAFAFAFAFAPVPSFPFFSFLASVFPGVPREASPVASPDPDPVPPPRGGAVFVPGGGSVSLRRVSRGNSPPPPRLLDELHPAGHLRRRVVVELVRAPAPEARQTRRLPSHAAARVAARVRPRARLRERSHARGRVAHGRAQREHRAELRRGATPSDVRAAGTF